MAPKTALVAVIAALFLAGSPASAGPEQMDPAKAPQVSGPLEQKGTQCSSQDVRSDDGTLLGEATACVFVYSFETLSETDVLSEHGAAWLQTAFDAADGWCTTSLSTKLQIAEASLEAASPKGTAQAGKAKPATTKLVVDAGGAALEAGRISQSFTQQPGTAAAAVDKAKSGVTLGWQGRSSEPVALVSGLAYSYPFLDGEPGKISFGFSRFSVESC